MPAQFSPFTILTDPAKKATIVPVILFDRPRLPVTAVEILFSALTEWGDGAVEWDTDSERFYNGRIFQQKGTGVWNLPGNPLSDAMLIYGMALLVRAPVLDLVSFAAFQRPISLQVYHNSLRIPFSVMAIKNFG